MNCKFETFLLLGTETTGCPNKHGNSATNSISSFLWISIVIPDFERHNSIRLLDYFMKTENGCKDVSIKSSVLLYGSPCTYDGPLQLCQSFTFLLSYIPLWQSPDIFFRPYIGKLRALHFMVQSHVETVIDSFQCCSASVELGFVTSRPPWKFLFGKNETFKGASPGKLGFDDWCKIVAENSWY